MKRHRDLMIGALLLLAVSGASVLGIYISGYQVQVSGDLPGGAAPELVIGTWNLSGSGPGNYTFNGTYDNPDGDVVLHFACEDLTVSSVPNCNWAEGTDAHVFVMSDFGTMQNCGSSPKLTMRSGSNTIPVLIEIHPNSCPTNNLAITITGTI